MPAIRCRSSLRIRLKQYQSTVLLCGICQEPSIYPQLYPCGQHNSCLQCLVQHVEHETRARFDSNDPELFVLVFAACCPICKEGGVVDDTLSQCRIPPVETREHQAMCLVDLKVSLPSTCPYCTGTNVSDRHVRECVLRRQRCPMDDCDIGTYAPSQGFNHHIKNECTGLVCPVCPCKTSMNHSEFIAHLRQHSPEQQLVFNFRAIMKSVESSTDDKQAAAAFLHAWKEALTSNNSVYRGRLLGVLSDATRQIRQDACDYRAHSHVTTPHSVPLPAI